MNLIARCLSTNPNTRVFGKCIQQTRGYHRNSFHRQVSYLGLKISKFLTNRLLTQVGKISRYIENTNALLENKQINHINERLNRAKSYHVRVETVDKQHFIVDFQEKLEIVNNDKFQKYVDHFNTSGAREPIGSDYYIDQLRSSLGNPSPLRSYVEQHLNTTD